MSVITAKADASTMLRSRLRALFDRTAERGAVLVCAPYGYGKTSALAAYARENDGIYCRIEPQESLLGFLGSLVQALAVRAPGLAATLSGAHERALQTPDPPATLASWFARHLADQRCTIAVDDLQHARDDRVARFLAHAFERSPSVRWIVGTESLEDLPLASYLAHGTAALPIQEDALRLTRFEAQEAAAVLAPGLGGTEILHLLRRTGGVPSSFAFAVQIAANSPVKAAFAGENDDLPARVLGALDGGERRVVVATSALPALDDEAVAHVAGNEGIAIMATLRRTAPYVFEPGGSRYHSAFQIELKAERERSPDRAEIELRTAEALEAAGDVAGALRHLQACGDGKAVAQLLDRRGLAAVESTDWYVVRDAVHSLDDELTRNSPTALALLAQITDFEGRLDVSEALFQNALRVSRSLEDSWRIKFWYGQFLVRRGRAANALDLLQPEAELRELPAKLQVQLMCVACAAHSSEQRFDLARSWIDRALEIASTLDDPIEDARVLHQVAYIAMRCGDGARAKSSALEAAARAERAGAYDIGSSALSVVYNVAYDEEDLDTAVGLLHRMAICGAKAGSVEKQFYALAAAYEIEVERGNVSSAASLEAEMRQFEVQYGAKVTSEGVLPAHVLQLAWHGDFESALLIIKPSVGDQLDPGRLALRWSEVAVYAAAAGSEAEANLALTAVLRALGSVGAECAQRYRAELFSALAYVLLGRCAQGKSLASRCLRELPAERGGLHALGAAISALADWRTTQADPRDLMAALESLHARQFGGYARLLEALPQACVGPLDSGLSSAIA